MHVRGKTVLITGASSGIGAATAKLMAMAGARPILVARNQERLSQVAAKLASANYEVHTYTADLTDADQVADVMATLCREVSVPDIVINNAGAGRFLFTEETRPGDAVQMMAAPYFAAFYVTRALLPPMKKRGHGFIVNVTSPAAWFPWPGATAYTAARWAMRGFTKALQADLQGTGIRTCLVVPSKVSSDYWSHNPRSEERLPKIAKLLPTLTPDQAAAGILKAIEKNKKEYLFPFQLKLMQMLHRLCPPLTEWLVATSGYKKADEATS